MTAQGGNGLLVVLANIALARQRMKMIYKLMTTDATYDKEILIASHLERISAELPPTPPSVNG